MIRLSDFITKIRNCKTMAEERAETQKQMAAIRQSFSKNQQNLRLRNVTKLLFINMMGQDTDFGQMECLKLITASTFIEKRIGYLGLTQLFHERSELLMMATHRLRLDLTSGNNYIVGLTLSVLSQICTPEHAKQLAPQIIKLISNTSSYIRKKALLTASKIIRKSPQFIPQIISKIQNILDDKHHGVLLGIMGFLQTSLAVDESHVHVPKLVKLIPRINKVYKIMLSNHSPQYQISGTNDPFLQVAFLKFMRSLLKFDKSITAEVTSILLQVHEFINSKHASSLKNGASAVLFQCFQTIITLQITPQLKQMIGSLISKFVSVKDANTKYLTLYTLNLLAKYDINSVQNHRVTIYQCLNQNDILIRVMALDLLYLIANIDNVVLIVKDLLNTLLHANDEQFITQLSLKICLIVDKQSPSRRWHFDTILKVLILAGFAVKQESTSSLVHLISSTPQLQTYAMIKLFFASTQNTSNQTLSKIVLYLIGEFGQVLLQAKQVKITQDNILTLIQNIVLRVGVSDDTISYGLSTLFKLAEKTNQKYRILGLIKSFQNSGSVEVQKRACEYSKLLESDWDEDRKKQICIPIPVLATYSETFKTIPIGSTQVNLDNPNIILPEKIDRPKRQETKPPAQNQIQQKTEIISTAPVKKPINIFEFQQQVTVQPVIKQTLPQPAKVEQKKQQPDLLGQIFFGDAPNPPQKQNPQTSNQFGNINFLSGNQTVLNPPVQTYTNNFLGNTGINMNPNNLLGNNQINNNKLIGVQNPINQTGFNFNSNLVNTGSQNTNINYGLNLLNNDTSLQINNPPINNFLLNPIQQNPPQNNQNPINLLGFQQPQNPKPAMGNTFGGSKFKAYQNQHLQIIMNCNKQSADTSNIVAVFNNKTNLLIENLTLQIAVMKHLKLTMNPLSTTRLQANSKDIVNQKMKLVNSTVGKGIVMKIKLSYNINGEKVMEQGKISNFPQGY